ncbi:MAG: DeoR/GlpR family DNA-binding transcription regulator [Candidatus Marinimicrobia bacterium]|nr:DeoR/GlpR family DNA-binding transcription regulator [Candidatus Neomarinimicrobiota bacterium]MCF7922999.1 DeoR/GlpR family DNA-binding transcription regulator [Candidatus Neomarinimicrobiota bacterium]
MKNKTTERRQSILEKIHEQGSARVENMAKEYAVSEVTIRNDLKYMEERGLIHRSHGGALLKHNVGFDHPLIEKQRLKMPEKREIAQTAAGLVENGDSIILDSGTTTFEMLNHLGDVTDLTILTNAVNIAYAAISLPNIQTLLTGGFLRKKSFSLVGPDAEELLSKYYVDKLFIGVDGLDLAYGISTPNPEEASLNRIMVSIAREVIVVADSSKFGRSSLSKICGLEAITKIITDKGLDPEFRRQLEARGIEVIITS